MLATFSNFSTWRIPPPICTGIFTECSISEIIERLLESLPKAASRSIMCNMSAPSFSHFLATWTGSLLYTFLVDWSPFVNLTTSPFIISMAANTFILFFHKHLQNFSLFGLQFFLIFQGETGFQTD